ncbi:unnamed protein product [Ostreobium quekettii]|uniref:mitogen-activated protein kinase kinase kinase n=1 Tax=Ostreobium quekettii TaxID=121088 RepID=A0A8S1J9M1_9CHLO|nr:unnamed protein product [Ostreobium quekettii]|eukprot:evm.model.scf_2179.5 EVM.evm.TU.scf_2179.5   scf_2179:23591-26738(+)
MGNLCSSARAADTPERVQADSPVGDIIIFPDDGAPFPDPDHRPRRPDGSFRVPQPACRNEFVVEIGTADRPGEIRVDLPDAKSFKDGGERGRREGFEGREAAGGKGGPTSNKRGRPSVTVDIPAADIHFAMGGGYEDRTPMRWTRGELIGAGAYGRVYLGLNQVSGRLMAVKQVQTPNDESCRSRVAEHVKALEEEVRMLKQLKSPNIVQYLGTERTGDTVNIFLEYAAGGSVASLLSKFGAFQETLTRLFTKQILQGLEFLHRNGIAHRDIKGGNILVDHNGAVKLADFGASKRIEDLVTLNSGFKSLKGTPYWMAPEVIKQTGHGRQADIWSVGCTVIEMATGKPPWSEFTNNVTVMFHIASAKGPPTIPETLSLEAQDFLRMCFHRNPKERPNATRLLKHPFVAHAGERAPAYSDPPSDRPIDLEHRLPWFDMPASGEDRPREELQRQPCPSTWVHERRLVP